MEIHTNSNPSPCAFVEYHIFQVGRVGEVQLQSRCTTGGAKSGWNMIDYPPHRWRINEDQEDYDDQISNPTDVEIAV